ncbi:MAG TPA: phosphoribosylformylglycinamidine synthase subunit PurL [Candidatus Eremiobacteraceae bacterium]|nr:phosphoribosylformylglycinamidine synthase subunit PurL [Candidatus Eremiobacteraceae bacterium]
MSISAAIDSIAYAAQQLAVEGDDERLKRLATSEALALTPHELRAIVERLGRNPTRAEAHAFAIQWSEHCSYKSSRALLAQLPVNSRDVLVPVGEDAGVLRAGKVRGVEYGVVVAHESHNHPSQVVPFEGAATGVGGILRDVLCMGAEVVASGDPLRLGPPQPGSHAAYVAAGVVEGIAAYGNAVGVPNLAGDVYFHPSYTENCLVNVVALGFVESAHIIHSRVPPGGAGYDLILVGKATDASGFGGAAFASLTLDATEAQANKRAVQVPDPFLKNVIMRASYAVFEQVKQSNIAAGFKDLGAGGIMGASSELCAAGGFGAEIQIDAVPQAIAGLPPFVVACSETQERMLWAVPPSFTPDVLAIYNERYTLPDISAGACAAVIGRVTQEQRYVILAGDTAVCDLPIATLTQPPRANWPMAPPPAEPHKVPTLPLGDARTTLLQILAHPDVCSRRSLIEHYDTVVRGATAIPSGYADAGVVVVKRSAPLGVALSVDGNARYGAVSAKGAAAHAVVESARNVAAVGAVPIGLTDCLNYGNPEDPQQYRELADGVAGLAEAARALTLGGEEALPFVSGNVSLYNQSASGSAVAPSAIVACLGRVDDVGRLVTMQLVAPQDHLYLLGGRREEVGGSVIAQLRGITAPGPLPPLDYNAANAEIQTVVAAIRLGCINAAHDISDGGLLACVAEMCLGGCADGTIGAALLPLAAWAPGISPAAALFGEAGGFVVAVPAVRAADFEKTAQRYGAAHCKLGVTGGDSLKLSGVLDVPLTQLAAAWGGTLQELFA